MQRLEVSGAVQPIYGSLGVKRLTNATRCPQNHSYLERAKHLACFLLVSTSFVWRW